MGSKTSIVMDNMALEKSMTYTFDASVGGFLVVYPNKDQKTTFEFKFWAGSVPPAAKGGSTAMIIGIVVGVLVIILVLAAVMKIKKNKENN